MNRILTILLLCCTFVACGKKADTPGAGSDSTKSSTSSSTESNATASSAGAPADANPAGATTGKYKVKSGMVEISNSMWPGMKQTLYFDDYGAKEAMYIDAEMMGTKISTVNITKDGMAYKYDAIKKEGTSMKSPAAPGANDQLPTPDQMSDEMKAKYKYQDLGTKEIAGKEAKGYAVEMMGVKNKTWVWNNIPLHREIEMEEGMPRTIDATKVETDVAIPADKFDVPSDVKITEKSDAPVMAPSTP